MALLAQLYLANCLLLLPLFAVIFAADIDAYGSRSTLMKPKQHGDQSLLSTNIGIQGVIYCRSGSKLVQLQANPHTIVFNFDGDRHWTVPAKKIEQLLNCLDMARITCLAVDGRGYETAPFCILSRPTDANGYFSATLSQTEVEDDWKITRCKAFLESSPLETCKVPTDVNRGVTGALLLSYRLSKDKRMKWFSVGPFVYTS